MNVVLEARRRSGLSQAELAAAAGTSRPTLSAYEHDRKSPSLSTTERIVEAAGFHLDLVPMVRFADVVTARNRVISVPDRLWRLPLDRALATVRLPLHVAWSGTRDVDLSDRRQRARAYEVLLREGTAEDLLSYVDGVLLLDLWSELVLPRDIREAWPSALEAAAYRSLAESVS